jgi:ssDNA-binding replication factor A large subunit
MDSKKFATPQKRRLFEDLSDIEPCTAGIHCAIETLSPVKKSQKGVSYYHGVVTDGKNRVPIVGFDTGTQQKLSCFHLRNETVHLDNCLIKKKSQSDDFEILLNKATVVTPSPKKFDVSKVSVETAEDLKIGDLDTIEDGTKVTLKGVVVSLAPVRAVSTGRVQDVTIYDPSGSVNLSVWEENINKLEVGKHYKFCNVYVHSFIVEKNIYHSH